MRNERVDTDRLLADYRDGKSTRQIAEEHGIRHGTIYKVLDRVGEPRRGRPPVTVGKAEQIVAAWRNGEPANDIADRFGISRRTVQNVVERGGVPRRKPGPRHQEFSQTQLERIREMRESGLPIGDITAEFNCGPGRVARALDRMGLSRTRSPRRGIARPTHGGYAVVWVPEDDPMASMRFQRTGYVLEHRLVMAHSLGRPLTRHETVHHIDGNRLNNDLANLQLHSKKHGAGVRHRCLDCGSHNIETTELA